MINYFYLILFVFSFQTIPIVHLEDVYITGLCASSCHLRREHDKGFKARPMDKISDYQIQVKNDITVVLKRLKWFAVISETVVQEFLCKVLYIWSKAYG